MNKGWEKNDRIYWKITDIGDSDNPCVSDIRDKINKIYARREKAHQELLKCDMEIDKILWEALE